MSHTANPFVVLLDANVLFPFRTRDILLTFSQLGLFRARFSETIIEEWSRSLIAKRPYLEASVTKQVEIIKREFAECFVEGYEPLIDTVHLPDDDDRHVLAAALKCSAQIIVTENLKDFPAETLEPHGMEALSADDALTNTFSLFPVECSKALRIVRTRYENPPFSPSEFLIDLTRCGLPKLSASAREFIEHL